MSDPRADLQLAREVLAAQPFSSLIGARLTEFRPGTATLEIVVRDELRQQHGFLHGGVVCYAADNVLTFAAGTVAGPDLVTGGFSIEYLRPAVGTTMRAVGHVVRSGRTKVVCRADVHVIDSDGGDVVCAIAQGTVSVRQRVAGTD
ncbi:PaaI family thioesterase [Nocardioides sp.]|uniref:PaaI family thioesterase n=1 Tax=Nocardioides sp. TaxID=35761 RepID=UPI002736CA17|nr:PaaI family thioesterase [Nocardioides sp.]MDP3890820.1 PaaI family thioesterase [Nocardioides sp.]